jgi:hypothetical protein
MTHQVQQFLNVNKLYYHKSNLTYLITELANTFVEGTHIAKCIEAENLLFTPLLRLNNALFMVKCLEDLFLHFVRVTKMATKLSQKLYDATEN